MKFVLLLLSIILLTGCTTIEYVKGEKVHMPNKYSKPIELIDETTHTDYILTNKNHIKQINDVGTDIRYINNGDMILSSILNFSRLSTDDKFGILQIDKIFLNTIDLKYLELPTSKSNVKVALIELKGKDERGKKIIRGIKRDKNDVVHIPIRYEEIKDKEQIEEMEDIKFYTSQKEGFFSKLSIKPASLSKDFHDRSMISIFANNNLGMKGFANIESNNTLLLKYVWHDQKEYNDNMDRYNELKNGNKFEAESFKEKAMILKNDTYIDIRKVISSLIKDENISVISTSLKLFDNNEDVKNFFKEKFNRLQSIEEFDENITNISMDKS